MARVGVYDQVKRAFQDMIAPELHALRGEIRVLDQRIIGLDQKIDGLRAETGSMKNELLAEIRRVDTRIDGVDVRIDGLAHEIRTVIDIRERLAALEARRSP